MKSQLERELKAEVERLTAIDEKLEVICSTIYTLFRTISCSTETSMIGLGFEDKVTPGNLTTCLGLIEQRFLELICILRFVGLHTVSIPACHNQPVVIQTYDSVALLHLRTITVICSRLPVVYTGSDPREPRRYS